MVIHASHNSYKVGMTNLLGRGSEGFCNEFDALPLSLQTFCLTTMRYDADWWNARSFESDECNLFHLIALWPKSDVSIQINVIGFIWLQLQMSLVKKACIINYFDSFVQNPAAFYSVAQL